MKVNSLSGAINKILSLTEQYVESELVKLVTEYGVRNEELVTQCPAST